MVYKWQLVISKLWVEFIAFQNIFLHQIQDSNSLVVHESRILFCWLAAFYHVNLNAFSR